MKSSHTKKSDEELYLELYGDKDSARKAFEEIYQRYSSKVYTFCSRVMGDTELADDIFQETFINFYESALVEREMKNVSAYIFKIARNLCINEKQKKHHTFVSVDDLDITLNENTSDSQERTKLLETALDALPKQFREVLVMKEYLGMSYHEISDAVGISVSTVRIRIYRAKTRLRELLSPYIEDFQDI